MRTALVNDVKGAHMLSNGIDLYGKGYTDCVLACRADLIKQNPAGAEGADQGHDEGPARSPRPSRKRR